MWTNRREAGECPAEYLYRKYHGEGNRYYYYHFVDSTLILTETNSKRHSWPVFLGGKVTAEGRSSYGFLPTTWRRSVHRQQSQTEL